MPDWTIDFFTTAALDSWHRSRTHDETLAEVAFLQQALVLDAGPRRLLDVACGAGRHAIALAKQGHKVTGVDIAAENADRAREQCELAQVEFDIIVGDMRALPARVEFDGAYCLGNSFGYFPRQETQRFLAEVAAVLPQGARFVIDTATAAESILLDLHPQTWQRIDDELLVLLECDYDVSESRLETTYTTIKGREVIDARTSHHYVFTSGEIVAMLHSAGFETLTMLADLDGTPFALGADRLLLTAERY